MGAADITTQKRKEIMFSFGPWYQLYIKQYKNGERATRRELKRVDDTLTFMTPAAFVAPDGIPIPNDQGEYEVRCFQENALSLVRLVLTEHHGLVIEREIRNEE